MRILVTVGTTRFDSLIKYLDETFAGLDFEFTFQIADGKYEPVNFPFFTYSSDINTYYKESDLVICHAGAGTIYKLLESRKKVIIVPNTERTDNHQLDIAKYMGANGYAVTVKDFTLLPESIQKASHFDFRIFEKHDFDKTREIISFCLGKLEN
ncbi:PssE/Cps14G family polysaccharide biosynthesis glycosyltransferase [Cyclobacterium amurskyense]|uniref:Glycosyltransferase 28 domain-containing protein n=1 Tax=Cyclobacterium amurskyense TaxID=320787 RepID=A0A0H4PBB0_9BACT|nr:PssE/Cps14G family polysaccharide biosynthesis glycosyltransferase [Cyclobacterium amurskyense]AKP50058.1 Glycosyltransferase 28 domain-containing protein [Cyclobacterium amurskyense]|tara:strand:+ start:40014 stop:40475 length:462 start_codon:yes stop_codon:yes gene_type:complete